MRKEMSCPRNNRTTLSSSPSSLLAFVVSKKIQIWTGWVKCSFVVLDFLLQRHPYWTWIWSRQNLTSSKLAEVGRQFTNDSASHSTASSKEFCFLARTQSDDPIHILDLFVPDAFFPYSTCFAGATSVTDWNDFVVPLPPSPSAATSC